jgi:hypothetical protein
MIWSMGGPVEAQLPRTYQAEHGVVTVPTWIWDSFQEPSLETERLSLDFNNFDAPRRLKVNFGKTF